MLILAPITTDKRNKTPEELKRVHRQVKDRQDKK
jgi:hypothetical protein